MDRLGTAIFRSLKGFVRVANIDTDIHDRTSPAQPTLFLMGWDMQDTRCVWRRVWAFAKWRMACFRRAVRRISAHASWRLNDFHRLARLALAGSAESRKPPRAALAMGVILIAAMVWTKPVQRGGISPLPTSARDEAATLPAASRATLRVKPQGVVLVSPSAHSLYKDFHKIGYRLEDVRRGDGAVPRVYVKAMPKDIGEVPSIAKRKAVFIKTILPLVLRTNEELRAIREKVKALAARTAKGKAIAPVERAWLAAQYDRFDVSRGDLAELLLRVDVIPPSLAVAQAAEESGWGSSRFALEGRALFGQRTHSKLPGLVPENRAPGARFKVKSFQHLLEGVRSYAQNLNTHPAYDAFRAVRARMRAEAGRTRSLDVYRLVNALKNYSERGTDYLKTIKSIIRANDLRELDRARLRQALDEAPETQNPA